MKHLLTRALLPALCLGLIGAVQVAPLKGQAAPPDLTDLNFEVKSAKTRLDLVTGTLARAREQYKAGLTPVSELEAAQANVDTATTDFQRLLRERDAVEARLAFRRPVTIQLDHSTVRQFAAALSKATGMSVKVDAAVPADAPVKLTLDAQGVPLANVLEAIANKADLMIAPDNGGVILKMWPHLNNQVIRTSTAPWSSDWNVPPTITAAGFGGNQALAPGGNPAGGGFNPFGANPGLGPQADRGQPGANPFFGGGQPGAFGGQPGQQPGQFGGQYIPQSGQPFPGGPGQPGFPGQPNGMSPMMGMSGPGFSLTSAGNNVIVIGEAGSGDNGEPGVWLTAYSVDGIGFKRLGRIFHPFINRPRGPQPGRGPDPRGGGPGPGQPGNRAPGGYGGSG